MVFPLGYFIKLRRLRFLSTTNFTTDLQTTMKGGLLVATFHLFYLQGSLAFLPPSSSSSKTNKAASTNNPFVQNVFSALSDFTDKLQPIFGNDENNGKKKNNSDDGDVTKVVETPNEILARLGIKLSYPKVAYVDPEKKFDIATAVMPVSILMLKSSSTL